MADKENGIRDNTIKYIKCCKKGNIAVCVDLTTKCGCMCACCGVFLILLGTSITLLTIFLIYLVPIVGEVQNLVVNVNVLVKDDAKSISSKVQDLIDSGTGLMNDDVKNITSKVNGILNSTQDIVDTDIRNMTSEVNGIIHDVHNIIIEKNATVGDILEKVLDTLTYANETIRSANTTFTDILDTTREIRNAVSQWNNPPSVPVTGGSNLPISGGGTGLPISSEG